jgi:hypothetical protein
VEGLVEPLPPDLRVALRRAALDHALSERRRHFTPALHVGCPGGPQAVLALEPGERLDHTLRTDVVAALLARATRFGPDPLVWLTRSGDLGLQDLDALWLAAACAASAEAGTPLTLVVVNRHGWRDPRSGTSRTWRRLRRR